MASLRDLDLQASYHKGRDDIAGDFYLPCVAASVRYDRAVGFFNSAIYSLAWPSLSSFVAGDGRMRVICSPVLLPEDVDALEKGYQDRVEATVGERLKGEIIALAASNQMRRATAVLASLVSLGVLELKIAFVGLEGGRRLFHDKVGIFHDSSGDAVAFKGSMNETWSGLSLDGNLESVDVFVSWEAPREAKRVRDEVDYFEELWRNVYPGTRVAAFPEVAREQLLSYSEPDRWREIADELSGEISEASNRSPDPPVGPRRVPRPHQVEALKSWHQQGRRGILEHATGSGKTFTALCAIRESLGLEEVALIVVPSELLLQQWDLEVRETLRDLDPALLLCGGGHDRWRRKRAG